MDDTGSPRYRVLVWQAPGGFAGEDLHRLAHRRLQPLLDRRLGHGVVAVEFELGPVEGALRRCARQADHRPHALVLPAFRQQLWDSLAAIGQLAVTAPDITVLLSGWGANPDYLDAIGRPLSHPRLVIARGEVEEGLVDALATLAGSPGSPFPTAQLAGHDLALPAPGGGWLQRGRFRVVADLGTLPSIYGTGQLAPSERAREAFVEVARGCRFRCAFCLSCNFDPHGVRPFPTAAIVAEIEAALERGARSLALLCSALNYDVAVIERIAAVINALPPAARPTIESTVHAALLDPRRLSAIASLRWSRMIVGLQTITPAAVALMGRQVEPERFRRAIQTLARVAVPTVEIILGLPGDTLSGFARTLKFVLGLPARIEVYHLRLDPGSLLMARRAELGIEADFADQGKVKQTPTFAAAELDQAALLLRRLATRPWKHPARSLGFDFESLYEATVP